jgi:arylsulfatase A-like enzyme
VPAAGLEAPRVVVLVTLDTTRADHLGCYGYPRPTTPFVDSLAQSGVLFENAFSAISLTGASHATLFTGLQPDQHRHWRNGESFPERGTPDGDRFTTLAERFAAHAYATAAFTAVRWLHGITRGFGYVNLGEVGPGVAQRPADATVLQVIDWLKLRRPGERLFVWIHLFDPHMPRSAPATQVQALRFRSPSEAQRFGTDAVASRGVPVGAFPGPVELAQAYAAYDAEIRFADDELGRLHAFMDRAGWLRDAWWIVTADHGEGLGQHGHMEHGRFVYDEQVRVPLVVSGTGLARGRRVRELAHLADVWPTFVALLGEAPAQPKHALAGVSLLPALRGTASLPTRPIFATRRLTGPTQWEPGDLFAVRDLDWKYIAKSEGQDELYDLRHDPLELRNRIDDSLPVRERLEHLARTTWARLRAEGGPAGPPQPLDPKTEEELRALGYIN